MSSQVKERIFDWRGILKNFWNEDEPTIDDNENNEVISGVEPEYEEYVSESNKRLKSLEDKYDASKYKVKHNTMSKKNRKNVVGKVGVGELKRENGDNLVENPNKEDIDKSREEKEIGG